VVARHGWRACDTSQHCAPSQATFTQSLCYAVYMFCNALERRAYRASLGCSGGDAGCCIAKQGGAAPSRASTQAQGAPFALAGCEPLGSTSAHAQPHADNKQHDTLPAYSSKVRRIRVSAVAEPGHACSCASPAYGCPFVAAALVQFAGCCPGTCPNPCSAMCLHKRGLRG